MIQPAQQMKAPYLALDYGFLAQGVKKIAKRLTEVRT